MVRQTKALVVRPTRDPPNRTFRRRSPVAGGHGAPGRRSRSVMARLSSVWPRRATVRRGHEHPHGKKSALAKRG